MKDKEKVFVRTNFNENNSRPNRQKRQPREPREPREPVERGERQKNQRNERKNPNYQHPKKYAQKSNRDAFKQILQSFTPLTQMSQNMQKISSAFPGFFLKKSRAPQKQSSECLNEFVIFNAKKYIESLTDKSKQQTPMIESSDPQWNSDEDVDCNLESRKIQTTVIDKVNEKLGDKIVKKDDVLKRHEKQFLEDYYKSKRLRQQLEQNNKVEAPKIVKVQPVKQQVKQQKQLVKQQKVEVKPIVQAQPINIWSDYQEKQVSSFINKGLMTKIQDNEDELGDIEVVEEDDLFNDDFDQQTQSVVQKQQNSSSEQEDDVFGDDGPTTTTIKSTKIIEQKSASLGTVKINDRVFHEIAEKLGLIPLKCSWILMDSAGKNKYRVTTEYMDCVYKKQRINEILPYVSLYHSEFVLASEIQSPEAMEKFRNFNLRLRSSNNTIQRQYKGKTAYNEKQTNYQAKKK